MLRNFHVAFLGSLVLFGLLLLPVASHAQSGIQMLPPLQPGGSACPKQAGVPQVLAWDGESPLYCIHDFTADKDGNIGVNSLNSTGILASGDQVHGGNGGLLVGPHQFFGSMNSTTFGLFDGVGSLTLRGGNVAITRDASAATVTIDGASPLNKDSALTVNSLRDAPVCDAGYVLTKIGANSFICTAETGDFTSCPSGHFLTGMSKGKPVCTPLTLGCHTGLVMQGIVYGWPVCVSH